MARLIDDVRAAKQYQAPFWLDLAHTDNWRKRTSRIMPMLHEEIPVLLIDNVADYYFSGTDQEFWDLRTHFPNLAPPFEVFWTEHRLPKKIHSTIGDHHMAHCGAKARTGILWMASQDFTGEDIPPDVKWILTAELFVDYDLYGRDIEGPAGTWFFGIDAQGVIVDRPFIQGYVADQWRELIAGWVPWLHPALLAISFLHCKNVKLIDNDPDKPLAKKYEARTGIRPTKWHTLEIEPLKQILRHQGSSHEVGVAKAMHICRGHFADYRDGRGLFGKYKQLVWFPQTIRGTKGDKAPPREVTFKL